MCHCLPTPNSRSSPRKSAWRVWELRMTPSKNSLPYIFNLESKRTLNLIFCSSIGSPSNSGFAFRTESAKLTELDFWAHSVNLNMRWAIRFEDVLAHLFFLSKTQNSSLRSYHLSRRWPVRRSTRLLSISLATSWLTPSLVPRISSSNFSCWKMTSLFVLIYRAWAATIQRPFQVRYNAYTQKIEVLDKVSVLQRLARDIKSET